MKRFELMLKARVSVEEDPQKQMPIVRAADPEPATAGHRHSPWCFARCKSSHQRMPSQYHHYLRCLPRSCGNTVVSDQRAIRADRFGVGPPEAGWRVITRRAGASDAHPPLNRENSNTHTSPVDRIPSSSLIFLAMRECCRWRDPEPESAPLREVSLRRSPSLVPVPNSSPSSSPCSLRLSPTTGDEPMLHDMMVNQWK